MIQANEFRIGNLVITKPSDYLIYKIMSIEHSIKYRR